MKKCGNAAGKSRSIKITLITVGSSEEKNVMRH